MESAAVILAGGTAARLGGADKAAIERAGRTFLEHALAATAAAAEVVVVGAPVPTSRPATFVREDPPFGGPAAGLLAGRRAVAGSPDLVWVQAVDMPMVTAATYERLVAASSGHDGAVLCDGQGKRQLVLVVRAEALDRVLPEGAHGMAVHRLLAPLALAEVPARDDEARDVDTWPDVARICEP